MLFHHECVDFSALFLLSIDAQHSLIMSVFALDQIITKKKNKSSETYIQQDIEHFLLPLQIKRFLFQYYYILYVYIHIYISFIIIIIIIVICSLSAKSIFTWNSPKVDFQGIFMVRCSYLKAFYYNALVNSGTISFQWNIFYFFFRIFLCFVIQLSRRGQNQNHRTVHHGWSW